MYDWYFIHYKNQNLIPMLLYTFKWIFCQAPSPFFDF